MMKRARRWPGLLPGWSGCGRALRGLVHQPRSHAHWASPPPLVLGLGGWALFAVVGHWSADGHRRLASKASVSSWPVAAPWTSISALHRWRRTCLCAWGCWMWYRNFYGFTSRCVAPYHASMCRYAAYLQQLEMESNGKRVALDGSTLTCATSPAIWGEPGTNGQHAFFQMLHQGADVLPAGDRGRAQASHPLPGHQQRCWPTLWRRRRR